ncbi:HlyD family efflux transporter periplasmic adaptor subunit [Stieleria sp. TO1_6]|uniref:efflux RND transporter periplasmic adaptor subunit n=1 Tax=Stieleria tagensis TaxID=2956795 RepID=UPI00209B9C24|nr:HlyD family efflux transporter periplasmic adaptor subunit [Stieleria tagensis]MCO8120401.1 HlyD family efflux transporter periplasmic adaptor subunit [Stieleria tagensis]
MGRQKLSNSAMSPSGDCDESWSEIEQFVAEISELSQSSHSLAEFASQSLRQTVELLAAHSASLWVVGQQSELQPVCHVDQHAQLNPAEVDCSAPHTRFLQAVIHSGKPQSSPAQQQSDQIWIAVPIQLDRDVVGTIEVTQPAATNDATLLGNERLLAMVGELTGDFLRRQQLNDYKQATDRWQQYEILSQRAHASLDLQDTAYQLVNDGRLFIGCDRASLLIPRRGQMQTLAISGVDSFQRRSNLVRAMESLAAAVAPSGQWLRYRGQTDAMPPQLEQPVCEFSDESHSQSIDVIPLLSSSQTPPQQTGELIGMLILERFEGSEDAGSEERTTRVANLASSALRNAVEYDTLPLLSLARWVRRGQRAGQMQGRKLLIATAIALLAGLALWLIPATLRIDAQGEIQPAIQRHLYAPLDGEVVEVNSGHDEEVVADQVLVVLRSRQLELELQRLQGDYQTIQKKLLAVASARVQSGNDNASDRYPGQLAAEEQELKLQLDSQQTQIDLVKQQREFLNVRSPITGQLLTWNPQELLADRPVQRGQLLVSVADLSGPWILELDVPDRQIGHVIQAQRAQEQPLDVTFALATGRATTYRGKLLKMAGRTEVTDEGQAATRAEVTVPKTAIKMLRPGATIYAKIDCGQHSLGFVWLHDIFQTIRAWLFF